ncbi:hypothetical protein RhiirB3_526656 [Rhizophagus irregularis]|nr:hypothetical protein RhiirB3_526656 [Rhizophagus irregularis]
MCYNKNLISGEREVNVVVEVAKTSDEDGDNSEQLINKNSLSNQDVDMIEVPGNAEECVQEGGYEVIEVAKKTSDEDGDNSEQLINKNLLSNQDVDMIEVPENAEECVQEGGYEVIEVAKKTSDEDGDNSEQLINKNSLSNQDVDMIEFPGNADVCVQEAGDEVGKMTKTSYLCPVYNNRGTDEENMFGEQMVNNNSESNEEDVILFKNAFISEYYDDVESSFNALNITNDYNIWPQYTSLNAVELSQSHELSHFEHQVHSSTYLQLSEMYDYGDNYSQNIDLSLRDERKSLDINKSLKLSKKLLKETELKDSIISVAYPKYRNSENLNYLENNNFLNILENCLIAEIKSESQKCELLLNYYRTGAYLNKVLEDLKNELSDISEIIERNICTAIVDNFKFCKMISEK